MIVDFDKLNKKEIIVPIDVYQEKNKTITKIIYKDEEVLIDITDILKAAADAHKEVYLEQGRLKGLHEAYQDKKDLEAEDKKIV